MLRLALFLFVFTSVAAQAASDAVDRCNRAAEVLDEIMAIGDKSIPQDLLSRSNCVAVVPNLIKGAFIFGGKRGVGVISCRGVDGKGWTGPSTVKIEGGSVGLQIGGSSTDIVLLVMNPKGKDKLLSSKFTLGGDASVAAGPVGRTANAETDLQMRAEILSYSRARGVFAGISLQGSTLRGDEGADRDIYGHSVSRGDILNGAVQAPQSCSSFGQTLSKYSSEEHR
jgi:lipid-binding SYLF domain-containing protein